MCMLFAQDAAQPATVRRQSGGNPASDSRKLKHRTNVGCLQSCLRLFRLVYMLCYKLLHLPRRNPERESEFTVQGMFKKHLILPIQTRNAASALCSLVSCLKDLHPAFRTIVRYTVLVFLFAEFFIPYMERFNVWHTPDQGKSLIPAHRSPDICLVLHRYVSLIHCIFHRLQRVILFTVVHKRKIKCSDIFHLIQSSALIDYRIASTEHPIPPSFCIIYDARGKSPKPT